MASESIEHAINHLNGIEDLADHENNGSISNLSESAKSELSNALSLLDFDRTLEELRESNSALRNWGHELVEQIKQLENENNI